MPGEEEAAQRPKEQQETAQDLEKVTDFVEEKEIDANKAAANVKSLLSAKKQQVDSKTQREQQELASIKLKEEDIQLMVDELELTRQLAERTLREHKGDITAAIQSLL